MNHYEILYLFDIPGSEQDLQALTERIAGIIKNEGGSIVYQENLGRRRLSYPIKKLTQGMYQAVEFDMEPTQLKKLDRTLKLDQSIVRFQIISITPRTEADRRQTLPESVAPRHERKPRTEAPAPAPKPVAPQPELSSEELDKKLDELLEDDIIKE